MSDDVTSSRPRFDGFGVAETRLDLLVVHSVDARQVGARIPLDGPLSIGRSAREDVQLVVEDPSISRLHLTLEPGGDATVRLVDHGSKNHTYVDGRPVAEVRLCGETLLRIGETLLFVSPRVSPPPSDAELLGESPAIIELRRMADAIATSDLSVVIEGETGSGKELVARYLHRKSGRRGALLPVNCGAIPTELAEATLFGHRRGAFTGAVADAAGYFVAAHNGTLFLDEIAELPPSLQTKLLRALETREVTAVGTMKAEMVDVRVVAASNASLAAEVEAGRFRRDLYARLAGCVLYVPPLSARRADIVTLTRHFLAGAVALSAEAMEALVRYAWPMNVRELKAFCQRLALIAPAAEPIGAKTVLELLPRQALAAPAPVLDSLPLREQLVALLREHDGNITKVAACFGRHPRQIYRWLKKLELSPDSFRR